MIDLTKNAEKRIKSLIEPGYYLRFAVQSGGCSGYGYHLEFVPKDSQRSDDMLIVFSGFKMLVDTKSLDLLVGTTIDFIEEKFGSRFKFNNPNSTRDCGCGESFSCVR